jgi:hypothetical protein
MKILYILLTFFIIQQTLAQEINSDEKGHIVILEGIYYEGSACDVRGEGENQIRIRRLIKGFRIEQNIKGSKGIVHIEIPYTPNTVDSEGNILENKKTYKIVLKLKGIKAEQALKNGKNKHLIISKAEIKSLKIVKTIVGHYINHWNTPKQEKGILYQNDSIQIIKKWGRNLYFRKDGTFTDRCFAPCGIDVNIHQYNGKWKFEGDEIKIFDLKEKYNKANIYPTKKGFKMLVKSTGKFKVLSRDNTGLILEIINEYEIFVPINLKE